MSGLIGGWIRRNPSARRLRSFWSLRVAQIRRHPFVPAELPPVAQGNIHRPPLYHRA